MAIDWTVILTGVGTAITIIGFSYTILRNFKSDINAHIDRLEGNVKSLTNRLDGHAARIDQSYHMFCNIQNEIKQLHIDFITKDKRQNG